MGVEFVPFSKADVKNAEAIRNSVIEKLKDKVISAKAIKMLENYR